MSEYDQMFKEEGHEQLEIAEQALLSYEANPDVNFIEEAFRALHTFKGGAHIFSLTHLGDFAHMIESVLDGMRQNLFDRELKITDKLLIYIDHLKKMMDDPELNKKDLLAKNQVLLREIESIASKVSDSIKNTDQSKERAMLEAFIEEENQENVSTYYLSITPVAEIDLSSGHPAINIIEDIQELGQEKLQVDYVDVDNQVIKHWDLYLACQSTKEDLESQFMFIEDELVLNIHKVANFNLFKELGFDELLCALNKIPAVEKLNELSAYVMSLKESLVTTEDNTNSGNNGQPNSTIRVSTDKIDALMNLVSELVTDQGSLKRLSKQFEDPYFEGVVENIERHIRQLRDVAFDMSLVPIDRLTGKFRRLVRDCSLSVGKDIDFHVSGENTELDKIFIDKLSDPIVHILRNCVDHGIESADERRAMGKDEKGRITLDTFYSGAYVHIEISDDGRGINEDQVRKKAIQSGLVTADSILSREMVLSLIFEPGFSTAQKVTHVSGRGVGMDVVKKNIESIHGEVIVKSEAGKGTKFTIKVPLTLSIIDGLLIKADHLSFVIPIVDIDKCYEIKSESLLDNFDNLLMLDGEAIPFVGLRSELALNTMQIPDCSNIITVKCRNKKVAIIADSIIDKVQAVIKPISSYYKEQEFVAGATILGDGVVALVLDVNKLVAQKTKNK
ncbi:chemotaxis protein CheA [Fulvivirga ligni]|uniref:chemotaxis protein CheA n=1 Tax=Fulvivirga ligni TaxID=2904246 RepID=UPI001F354AE3|nr:chemotaxis protein CheA [Fulvivirga ligni]UII19037.1 chemotaxis protein CheA [Fulvivirga ligni]